MYGLCNKLGCLSKLVGLSMPVKMTIEKTLAYNDLCLFSENYKYIMFYCIGTRYQEQHFIFFVTYKWPS